MSRLHTLCVLAVAVNSGLAIAEECPGGSTSAEACIRERLHLEKKLGAAYLAKEKELRKQFESGYGGLEGDSYAKEAIKSFRAANNAWQSFRNAECWFLALNDGMNLSPDYASVVSEACKVERTKERLKLLNP